MEVVSIFLIRYTQDLQFLTKGNCLTPVASIPAMEILEHNL